MLRSEEKTKAAIDSIKASTPKSKGELVFIALDPSDLPSVKAAADEFLHRERELHLLFNNARVGYPDKGIRTKQGYELQPGVNCVSTFAFTKHLTPVLVSTARSAPPNSVRVIWVSSSAAEAVAPGAFVEKLAKIEEKAAFEQYCISNLGTYLHATEFKQANCGNSRSVGLALESLKRDDCRV